MRLEFAVYGHPVPQGSKRPFRNQHTGRIQLVEASNVTPWREAVKHAALDALAEANMPPMQTPARLTVEFVFARPRSHYRTGKYAHLLKGDAPIRPMSKRRNDLDKLLRSTLDALTDAGMWHDDSQVATVIAHKVYALDGSTTGAMLAVEPETQRMAIDISDIDPEPRDLLEQAQKAGIT